MLVNLGTERVNPLNRNIKIQILIILLPLYMYVSYRSSRENLLKYL